MRGNAEGEMLMQDEKDGEIRAVIPVRPSADWQEKSGEFHIETSVRALYFTYRGSGSIDWQWVLVLLKGEMVHGKGIFL